MLIITDTKTINSDLITCIGVCTNVKGIATLYADDYAIITGYNDVITKELYNDIIYSITSGKKSYNVAAHVSKIMETYSYREVVL